MSEIEAIKKYLEWAEERRIAGEPHSIEAYEEAMRVADLEAALDAIQLILLESRDSNIGKLEAIERVVFKEQSE